MPATAGPGCSTGALDRRCNHMRPPAAGTRTLGDRWPWWVHRRALGLEVKSERSLIKNWIFLYHRKLVHAGR